MTRTRLLVGTVGAVAVVGLGVGIAAATLDSGSNAPPGAVNESGAPGQTKGVSQTGYSALVSRAQSFLTSNKITATIDGTTVTPSVLAQETVAMAEHASAQPFDQSTAVDPADDLYVRRGVAVLVLNKLLADQGTESPRDR